MCIRDRVINTLFFNEDGGMVAKLSDSSNVGILIFLVMLGILVALMNKEMCIRDRFSPAVRALGRGQLLPAQNVDAQAQAVSLLCRTDKAVLLENDGCLTWGLSLIHILCPSCIPLLWAWASTLSCSAF